MLAGSLTLNGGTHVNIMSYIGKVLTPTLDNPLAGFLPEQIEILHVHANTPVRQTLRNHLQ